MVRDRRSVVSLPVLIQNGTRILINPLRITAPGLKGLSVPISMTHERLCPGRLLSASSDLQETNWEAHPWRSTHDLQVCGPHRSLTSALDMLMVFSIVKELLF